MIFVLSARHSVPRFSRMTTHSLDGIDSGVSETSEED